ncbi:MAG: hypothetical protein FWD71_04150, partial [Oscillospiraceae bacterium]|nr:hypothetical protein [Oscillospiraceae bacterium]
MQKLYYKITAIILAAFIILCFTPSCMANPDDSNSYKSSGDTLTDILANYRNDGMTSWWQIVAVYNAGENPMDYKGFDDILGSIIGDDNTVMASYVIVSDIAAVIGADPGYFEKYEEYKTKLKNLLENPLDSNTLNDYIFSYYALKCSGMIFDETSFLNYLSQAQKSDGGFALSGDAGDIDITAFVVPALKLLSSNADPVSSINPALPLMHNDVKFLPNNVGDDGACASVSANATENSNSTAVA